MEITVVYDNNSGRGLGKGWGFSCSIETDDKKILFDTGWDGGLLLENMATLGMDIREYDILLLSHQHWDHIGGLPAVLNANPKIEVYTLASFSEKLKKEIQKRTKLNEINGMCKIAEGVYSTGELGDIVKEQALLLDTDKGIYVISGCAHPGLPAIMEVAGSIGNVRGIIGGLHDCQDIEAMRDLELIGAGHCTSNIDAIKEKYPNSFVHIEAGYCIHI
ncbi:MBL fold metallo-hydrolase [Methanococcoides burtonii]|uniref:Protein with beta-lactamase-like domain n=1 Tax=Methanococcoides burtonii (strain DSM 6242 / NBRC 107633 / OCM 468 / ACE-M) TaxID=259564 RepID=Q12UC6_METBU|nr:MBL fold metallo-hydrolase [Methanococcoides burtonii]ABE52950.1 protein with beta-lactamase-like domain [Methanococcoides burtonii DSM 6242]